MGTGVAGRQHMQKAGMPICQGRKFKEGRKMIHRHSLFLSSVMTFISLLVFTGLAVGQGQDRGIITGLVADKTGAAVSGATVTITNEATGVNTVVSTTSAGNFSTPPLVLGSYKVQVELSGFKASIQSGVLVASGATVRVDVVLEVGSVSETVEVKTSSVEVNVSTAEVS